MSVQFTLDGSTLAGKTVVVFESVSYEGKEFAVHADLKDDGQTIYFPEIKTTAKDNVSGNHYAKPEKEITLIDTVSYQNLIPGKEYTLTGTLMDKETKKPLEVDGKPITAQTTFTPEKADGNVELSFTFDASALRGKPSVFLNRFYSKKKKLPFMLTLTTMNRAFTSRKSKQQPKMEQMMIKKFCHPKKLPS